MAPPRMPANMRRAVGTYPVYVRVDVVMSASTIFLYGRQAYSSYSLTP